MNKEEEPFEVTSDEEALKISKKSEKKGLSKILSNKTLIIIAVVIIVIGIGTYRNVQNEYQKTTMDIIYENLERSMSNEDIALMQELTSRAVQLLPEDEQEKLIELQTLFSKEGYSALTAEESKLMRELNNKAISLLPEEDMKRLDAIMKKMYDAMTR